jgi:hypothetical protein
MIRYQTSEWRRLQNARCSERYRGESPISDLTNHQNHLNLKRGRNLEPASVFLNEMVAAEEIRLIFYLYKIYEI